jgi:hemoglobin
MLAAPGFCRLKHGGQRLLAHCTKYPELHSGNGPHDEMDHRAIACFDQALNDVGLTTAQPLRQVLHDYFTWATTTTMSRYHESADDVPENMSIPRWSWDGLQL